MLRTVLLTLCLLVGMAQSQVYFGAYASGAIPHNDDSDRLEGNSFGGEYLLGLETGSADVVFRTGYVPYPARFGATTRQIPILFGLRMPRAFNAHSYGYFGVEAGFSIVRAFLDEYSFTIHPNVGINLDMGKEVAGELNIGYMYVDNGLSAIMVNLGMILGEKRYRKE